MSIPCIQGKYPQAGVDVDAGAEIWCLPRRGIRMVSMRENNGRWCQSNDVVSIVHHFSSGNWNASFSKVSGMSPNTSLKFVFLLPTFPSLILWYYKLEDNIFISPKESPIFCREWEDVSPNCSYLNVVALSRHSSSKEASARWEYCPRLQ